MLRNPDEYGVWNFALPLHPQDTAMTDNVKAVELNDMLAVDSPSNKSIGT